MPFWSGETLGLLLPGLISDFDPNRIDCATYRLRVGEQAFVTGDQSSPGPADPLVCVLGAPPRHTVRIAPGQFAFLLTLEDVRVPDSAIAFISMRARYKFKGLINVSGFHVDPGWQGRLLFSVYNAGPTEVILERGEQAFLIVYADLDQKTGAVYKGDAKHQNSINAGLLQNMTSQVFSPQVLKRQLDKVDEKMGRIELSVGIAAGVAAALAVVTGIVVATVALLPSWTGVVVARTLDAANYEIRQKPDVKDEDATRKQGAPAGAGTATVTPSASATTR